MQPETSISKSMTQKSVTRLSPEEESALARCFREQGDIEAAQILIQANIPFVVRIAHEYRGYRVDLQELIQEGSVGLAEAVHRYDPHRGVRLITYAVHHIRAHIHDYLKRNVRAYRVVNSRAHRRLFYKYRTLRNKIWALEGGNQERINRRIGEKLGIPVEEVELFEHYFVKPQISIHNMSRNSRDSTLESRIPDERPNQETRLAQFEEAVLLKSKLEKALGHLDKREYGVIAQRYLEEQPLAFNRIGESLGVSKQRAKQIELGSLKKLKKLVLDAA